MPAMQETQIQSLGQEDPWRKKWQPTPLFLPGDSMDKGTWQATVHGVTRLGPDWMTTLTFRIRQHFWNSRLIYFNINIFPDSRTDPPQENCKALESTGGRVITKMTWWTTNHVSPIKFPLIALYNKWRGTNSHVYWLHKVFECNS